MRLLLVGGLGAIVFCAPYAAGQAAANDDVVSVFTEHPRLFLRPARLRLLQKERERASARWQQFDAYVSADAPLPETGFAEALYYQVSGSAPAGRKAIAWALGPEGPGIRHDLRQLALVFDWCQKLLSESERRDLAARIVKGLNEAASEESIPAMRAQVLAAVALYDDVPDIPNRELQRAVRDWWERKIAPSIAKGQAPARDDAYALWEIFHAIRDNTNLDLRETAPRFFKSFPIEHLMSNYPATYPSEDNDFHIGASAKTGTPDLTRATFFRAAELAMVAFDTNAEESQYLQGWLMHDRFELRSALGAPYEFLWANQYQPGLSFTLLPLVYHNPDTGTVFVRSDWDESAQWFGYFDGVAQVFRDGHVEPVKLAGAPPLVLASAVIYFGATRFRVKLDADRSAAIVVGLAPGKTYQVEIDDEEVVEQAADRGGVLVLDVPQGRETGVRLRAVP
jgi:hypothetical protein